MKRHDYNVPEDLWKIVEPILPAEEMRPQGGRPPVPSYRIFGGVLYRLRTGCQWDAVPRHFGASSTLQRRFQQWSEAGLMDKIFEAALDFYDDLRGIGREWMSMDASNVKAPKGGDATGPNPTDRAKSGSKRHVVTDSRGVPVAVNVSAANVADCQMVDYAWTKPMIREKSSCTFDLVAVFLTSVDAASLRCRENTEARPGAGLWRGVTAGTTIFVGSKLGGSVAASIIERWCCEGARGLPFIMLWDPSESSFWALL